VLRRNVIAFTLAGLAGCATGPGGHASFTVASVRNYTAADGVELVAHVDRSICNHNLLLLFGWGEAADHEYLVKSILDETGGDAITNAELKFTSIPAILYNQSCASVSGDVVRFSRGH